MSFRGIFARYNFMGLLLFAKTKSELKETHLSSVEEIGARRAIAS